MAQCIEEKRKSSNKTPRDARQGEKKSQQSKQEPRSYLDGASDWRLLVDLENSLKVPRQVAETNLRPDILLVSDSSRKIGVVELTVPSEERIELSGELKRTKYRILQEDGKKNKWDVQVSGIFNGIISERDGSPRRREEKNVEQDGRSSRESKQKCLEVEPL